MPKRCIPGCKSIVKVSDTDINAKATLHVGQVKASFTGMVTLSDRDPPNGYKAADEGTGGVAGFAKGGATVSLHEDGGVTALNYVVNAQIGRKLVQLGARLINSTAKKLASEFSSILPKPLRPRVRRPRWRLRHCRPDLFPGIN